MKRFYDKISKCTETGCWNWTASCSSSGYGQFCIDGKKFQAHRLSYIFHVGEIPEGKCILHFCHNKKCVNPDHLHVGTHSINKYESRHASTTKLHENDHKIIFGLREIGLTQKQIAAQVGISNQHVSRILRGWRPMRTV